MIKSLQQNNVEKDEKITEKQAFLDELHTKNNTLIKQLNSKDNTLMKKQQEMELLIENETTISEFLKQAKNEIVRQKQLISTLQQQNQQQLSYISTAQNNTQNPEISTLNNASNNPFFVPSDINSSNTDSHVMSSTGIPLLENSIASDFLQTLNNHNTANMAMNGKPEEVSLTLEEIENAESNR